MDDYKFAIEIKNAASYQLACAIWPHLAELSYEQIRLNFLVFNDDGAGNFALYSPGSLAAVFSHIENGPIIAIKKLYPTQ